MTTNFDPNVFWRDEFLPVFNAHDVQQIVAFFVEDGTFVDNTEPSVVHTGRADIAEALKVLFGLFPDLRCEIKDSFAAGDRLALELVVHFTRPENEHVEVPMCAYYVFQGDKILSEHLYMDSAHLASSEWATR